MASACATAAWLPPIFVLVAACHDGGGAGTFEPRLVRELRLRPAAETEPGDLVSHHLAPGSSFLVEVHEVPGLRCVRGDTDDFLHIPEASDTPGEPAIIYSIAPRDASQPVVLALHGGGLDLIEGVASLFVHSAPAVARAILDADPGMAWLLDIDSRQGSQNAIEGSIDNAMVAGLLERGWGIVAPGNCWGDGGHGEGEIVTFPDDVSAYYVDGPRHGHTMDRAAWDWYRARHPHDVTREYSVACSGGGQRTAQLLLRDETATAASVIDSPADYLPGFLDEPRPQIFALLGALEGVESVLEAFYVAHYGGVEVAAAESLGMRMEADGIDTPIYLTYSHLDPMASAPVTAPLAAALSRREPSDRAVVIDTARDVHCQLQSREDAITVLDWLSRFRR